MRKLILVIALATATLTVAGCATIRNVDQAVALANQDVGNYTILDEKSWYYAEALYSVPATAYLSAYAHFPDRRDSLRANVKPILQELNRLRGLVYQAYKTGNAVTFREKIIQMKQLSDQARLAVGPQSSAAAPGASPAVLGAAVART